MKKSIVLAGGCFWGLDAYLNNLNGVTNTKACYANSNIEHPTYEDVCSGASTASEAVCVEYESETISLQNLLDAYYEVIDPTSINRQAHDIGQQYRTGIYFSDDSDLPLIRQSLHQLQSKLNDKIQIEVLPLANLYIAEDYHQDYLKKNPNGYCHIPKSTIELAKRKTFSLN